MSATLVFRLVGPPVEGPPDPPAAGIAFAFVPGVRDALAVARPLARRLGAAAACRAVAKLATPSRLLFCVLEDGEVVVHGWLSVGRSALYRVDPGDVVIGPVITVRRARGRGLATFGLRRALHAMAARGHGTFYVHAAEGNHASLRWIARSGFGEPIERRPPTRRC